MNTPRVESLCFCFGDYLADALTGTLTALAVRMVVGSRWDMVLAMLVGMALGMVVHFLLGRRRSFRFACGLWGALGGHDEIVMVDSGRKVRCGVTEREDELAAHRERILEASAAPPL